MTDTQAKALKSFYADGLGSVRRGQTINCSAAIAKDLESAGLVRTSSAPADDAPDPLEQKLADAPSNKLAEIPENKAVRRSKRIAE